MRFKFYIRKNVYGEYSLFTPDGNWIADLGSKYKAIEIRNHLNAFLKRASVK